MDQEWIEEVEPLLSGEILNKPLAKMTHAEMAEAYAYLHSIAALAESRKKTLREKLLTAAVKDGSATEKGGYVVNYDGTKVIRERRVATAPDSDKIRAMLEENKLVEDAAFTKVFALVLDPSKLEKLVETGKLDAEEIEEARDVNLALKVIPSNAIEQAILESRALYAEVFEEDATQAKLDKRQRTKKSSANGPRKGKKT